MTRDQAQQALSEARDESVRRAMTAHHRVRPFYSLAAKFAQHELLTCPPAEVPQVIEDLRAIYRGAALIERRAAQ